MKTEAGSGEGGGSAAACLPKQLLIEWKQKQGLAKVEEELLLACQNNF